MKKDIFMVREKKECLVIGGCPGSRQTALMLY